jgi:hypothetical protein
MAKRQLPEDFKDFIKFLNAHNVKYLLVGGWAVGLYGNPRATKEIDFFIGIDDENIKNFRKLYISLEHRQLMIKSLRKLEMYSEWGVLPFRLI